MLKPKPHIKGIAILCGGDSRRMGVDKALVDLDGSPILRRHIEEIRALNLKMPIYISSGERRYAIIDDFDVTYVHDVVRGGGPLAGLAGALLAASEGGATAGHIFTMPVDTLVPPSILLASLEKEGLAASGVALVKGERLHPVHGLFPISAAASLKQFVESGGRAVMGFLESLEIHEARIDKGWEPCLNFNYPDDFIAAREALAKIAVLTSQR